MLRPSPKGFQFYAPMAVVGIGADGAVLATSSSLAPPRLYRLPSGAATWQDLGPFPQPSLATSYFPTPSGGVLWLSVGSASAGLLTASYP